MNITERNIVSSDKKNKLYIFHPLNREIFKGSKVIISALKIIEKKYPNLVKIIVKGKVPFNEFMDLLNTSDIVVDQCKSYSYGMTALIGLHKGKILLSGVENETIMDLKIPPKMTFLINILPDESNIVSTIEGVVQNFINDSSFLQKNAILATNFVKEFHDTNLISLKYIDIFINHLSV